MFSGHKDSTDGRNAEPFLTTHYGTSIQPSQNQNFDYDQDDFMNRKRCKPKMPSQQDIVNQVIERLNRKQIVAERERKKLEQSYKHKPAIIPKSEYQKNMTTKITAHKLTQIFKNKMKQSVTMCENEPAPNFNRLRKHRAFLDEYQVKKSHSNKGS